MDDLTKDDYVRKVRAAMGLVVPGLGAYDAATNNPETEGANPRGVPSAAPPTANPGGAHRRDASTAEDAAARAAAEGAEQTAFRGGERAAGPVAPRPTGGGAVSVPDKEQWRVGPTVRGEFAEADKLAEEARTDRERGDSEEALSQEIAMHGYAQDMKAREDAMRAAAVQQKAVLQSYQEQADSLSDQARNTKIDASHFWESRTTGQKIAGIIGLALGGFVQARKGGRNAAADMIEQATQQDIDAQRAAMGNMNAAAERQRGLLHDARQRFGDERVAEQATFSAYLAKAEWEVKAIAAHAKDAETHARASEMLAALADKRAQRDAQLIQFIPAHVAGGGGGGHEGDIAEGKQANIFVAPDGEHYLARDADSRKRLAMAASANEDMKTMVDNYSAIVSNLSAEDKIKLRLGITTPKMAAANSAYYSLLSKERQLQNDGVYKKSEEPMFPKILTPPQAWTGDAKGQAAQARALADREFAHSMKSEAPFQVSTDFRKDAKNRTVPTASYTGGDYRQPSAAAPPPMPGKIRP